MSEEKNNTESQIPKNFQQEGGIEDIFENTDKPTSENISFQNTPLNQKPTSFKSSGQTALSSGKMKPVASYVQDETVPKEQMSRRGDFSFPLKKVLFILFFAIIIVSAAGISYASLSGIISFKNPFSKTKESEETEENTPQNQEFSEVTQQQESTNEAKDSPQTDQSPKEGGALQDSSEGVFENFQKSQIKKVLDPLSNPTIDTDQDGLTDVREIELGTNPRLVDSDSDGLSDWEEVDIFGTNPLKNDSDSDSYLDGEEVQNGYNPLGPGKLLDTQTDEYEAVDE